MPKCKNDPKRSYKGTEPSPKGLGYCAHTMKLNTKKKGTDASIIFIDILLHSNKISNILVYYLLYFLIPFIFATNTFITCNTSSITSSWGSLCSF